MGWVPYTIVAAAGFGAWAFLGKLALRHATWAQVGLAYALASTILFAAIQFSRTGQNFAGVNGWTLTGSAVCGAVGLVAFYIALDHGKASVVVPIVSVYPLITAVLALAFLGESVTALQAVGIGCALGGVILIGVGR
jgi:bacterial/archaeal transporter family protein